MRHLTILLLSLFTSPLLGQAGSCDNFTAAVSWSGGSGPALAFVGTTSLPANGMVWYFGDGGTANGPSVMHTYLQSGSYHVCLSAWMWNTATQDTCWTEVCEQVVVGAADPCDFLQPCYVPSQSGQNTVFFNNCTANEPGTTYYWDLGDGNGSSSIAPTHTFPGPGQYPVCLYAFWQNCVDSLCTSVTVGAPDPCLGLNAAFTANTTPNGTFFSNGTTGTGMQTQFFWDFGDGSTSSDAQPFHTYAQNGVYAVCLQAISLFQVTGGPMITCVDTTCSNITIGAGDPCDELEACIWVNDNGDGSFLFENCTSVIQGAQFTWDFGDGTGASSVIADHVYSQQGTYTVCLTAYWQNCVDSTCTSVTVMNEDPCTDLMAAFTSNTTPNGTFFSNGTTGTGMQTQFFWDFGDGSTSTDAQPFHTYAQDGTYQVCLQALSIYPVAGGNLITCIDTTCSYITIGEGNPCDALNAGFIGSGGVQGVNFANDVIDLAWTYLWDFGDGSTGYGPNPYHTFPAVGQYQVCLTVYTWDPVLQDSCSIEECEWIIVQGTNPCDDFAACFVDSQFGPSSFFFNNCTPNEPGTTFHWTFGDGIESNSVAPTHVYAEAGLYEVCLTALWANCVDSTCTTVTVINDDPCDGLSAAFTATTTPNGTQFSNGTTGTGFQTQFFWDFSDGSTSTNAQPFHTFPQDGTYQVCLQALSLYQVTGGNLVTCIDTVCSSITIGVGNPCDALNAGFSGSPAGLGVNFANEVIDLSWSYIWDFGDGTDGYGPNPYHTYPASGPYQVCLTVYTWDPVLQDTCFEDHCEWITVLSNEPCDGLVACFNALPFENGVYHFSNCSQILPIDIPENYFWDFGDGGSSTETEPDHSFAPGTYTICLIVEHGGCVDSTCTTLTVFGGPGCDPNFACDFTWQAQGTAVVFFGTANRPTDGMVWQLGDGTEGYGNVYTHLYEPPGPFEVCLHAWYWNEVTQDSCWTQQCHLVDPFNVVTSIGDGARSNFSVYPNPATDLITISGMTAGGELALFAPDGRLVLTERTAVGTHLITVGHLATGVYVLQLRIGTELLTRRIALDRGGQHGR